MERITKGEQQIPVKGFLIQGDSISDGIYWYVFIILG